MKTSIEIHHRDSASVVAAVLCSISLSGCYGTAIDTRDIDADEVNITTHTPWSQTTITAKGWRSRVKGQPETVSAPK